MGQMGVSGWLVVAVGLMVGASREVDRVGLSEATRVGDSTRVVVELKAEGVFKPASLPGEKEPKPLALQVETRLEFDDRVSEVEKSGAPSSSFRLVRRASATINGEVRPFASTLRAEVAGLLATRKAGTIVVASPSGPLTRSELDLVQGPGDPLVLALLLPTKPASVGDRWTVGDLASKNLSGYDSLASNALEATLESVDGSTARVRVLGTIRGATLGGEGSMACDGSFTFDRKTNRVDRLTLNRAETRRAGQIEAGLDVKSVLTVVRADLEPSSSKGIEEALGVLKTGEASSHLDDLLFLSPDKKYRLIHDRDWHIFWDDVRQVVLKRLDRGELVAQCNLSIGPNAGKGRHQDTKQFRDDIQRALGKRFVQFVGEGEVEGAPAGGYRYKVTVQGRQGDAGVLWHYYLIASPEGDQIIATFTLGLAQQAQFGEQDLSLIGSFEWLP